MSNHGAHFFLTLADEDPEKAYRLDLAEIRGAPTQAKKGHTDTTPCFPIPVKLSFQSRRT